MSKRDITNQYRERRDKLRLEMEAVRARLEEVECFLRNLEGERVVEAPPVERKSRRGDLKEVVLSLFEVAGEAGLSSPGCVIWAREKRGLELYVASVSSLLSRLKTDGALFYDGERYRLKKYAGPRGPIAGGWRDAIQVADFQNRGSPRISNHRHQRRALVRAR